jgi:hypothetical protein
MSNESKGALQVAPENKNGLPEALLDDFGERAIGNAVLATPGAASSNTALCDSATALIAAMDSIKPTDAIEKALGAQLFTANNTALELYRRAWIDTQSHEVRVKYLALADKSARTVAVLAQTLDRHRGRGQQIVVKHVTVNADQALLTDQLISGVDRVG